MRLILVRHGDAHAGFHGVIGGPTGCAGLTDRGREQAAALRDHLAVSGRVRADVLLSSVIPRAIETAEIIAPGLGIETFGRECDLCEVHTGEADGLEWAEWGVRYGSFDMEADPDRVFAPEGESWNSFHERVRQVLERLARGVRGPDGRRRVPRRRDHGVDADAARRRPAGDRRSAPADEHGAHRVGVGAGAGAVDAALVQRGEPPPPLAHGHGRDCRTHWVGVRHDGRRQVLGRRGASGRGARRAGRLGGRLPRQPGQ